MKVWIEVNYSPNLRWINLNSILKEVNSMLYNKKFLTDYNSNPLPCVCYNI